MFWKTLLVAVLAIGIKADQGQREVVLFNKADTNHDYMLTRNELDDIFLQFDSNNDSEITPTEFTNDWVNVFNIGGAQEAQALFTRADNDDDGVIDSKDIPAIFLFFDINGDGEVDISEFLTQWGQLKEEPNNTIDVSVDIAG